MIFGLLRAKMVGELFVKLVSKIFNLCGHDPPTSQTDGQTDGQTTSNSKTVLCTVVHRTVKSKSLYIYELIKILQTIITINMRCKLTLHTLLSVLTVHYIAKYSIAMFMMIRQTVKSLKYVKPPKRN